MEKAERRILEYVVLLSVLIAGLMFFRYIKNQDIDFCRKVFKGLVKGSYQVAKFMDWQSLKALDVDVGRTYTQLANEKEKLNYKKAFIKNFSLGFKKSGGRLNAFTHWRLNDKDSRNTVVAVDYRDKIMLFTVSQYAGRKITSLQWKDVD